jgi:hypothetical protein
LGKFRAEAPNDFTEIFKETNDIDKETNFGKDTERLWHMDLFRKTRLRIFHIVIESVLLYLDDVEIECCHT